MNKEEKTYYDLASKYQAILHCPECGGDGVLFKRTTIDDGYDVQCLNCDNTGVVHNTDHDVLVPLKELFKLFVATSLVDILREGLAEPDEDGGGYYLTPAGCKLILEACNLPTQGGKYVEY